MKQVKRKAGKSTDSGRKRKIVNNYYTCKSGECKLMWRQGVITPAIETHGCRCMVCAPRPLCFTKIHQSWKLP